MFNRSTMGRALLLAVIACACYLPCIHGEPIWDDNDFIFRSSMIHASDGLWRYWFTLEAPDYWPVTYSTFWIEHRLWGPWTVPYHLLNLVLHAASALLLWRLLVRLAVPGAWLVAAVFALHPVNVESVAWIFQRKNLLSLNFTLLGLHLQLLSTERLSSPPPVAVNLRRRAWWLHAASCLCFAMALLSKVAVVMTPVILLVLAWWRTGRVARRDLLWSAPWFALSAGLGAFNMRVKGERSLGEMVTLEGGLWSRLCSGATAVWFYLGKVVWPTNLAFVYPRWQVDAGDWRWWLGPAALLAGIAILWSLRGRWGRSPLAAALVYLLALLPTLHVTGIAYFRYSLVADHYQHMAMIAPLALLVAGMVVGWRRWAAAPPAVGAGAAAAMLLLLGVLTWRQAGVYRSEEVAWRDTIAKNPRSFLALNNLAGNLLDEGQVDEAQDLARRAIEANTKFQEAYATLGRSLAAQGRYDEALACYRQALELEPRFAEVWFNAGNAMMALHQHEGAVEAFRQARTIHLGYIDAYINEAATRLRMQDLTSAAAVLREALTHAPSHVEANFRLALVLGFQGQVEQATWQLRRVVELSPGHEQARSLLAQLGASATP